MKKIICIILCFIILFSMSACGDMGIGMNYLQNRINNDIGDEYNNYNSVEINPDEEEIVNYNYNENYNENEANNESNTLTTITIGMLSDENGYFYVDSYLGMLLLWTDDSFNTCKMTRIIDDFSPKYENLSSSEVWTVETYDDEHLSISEYWSGEYNLKVLYSDPDCQYIVLEETEEAEDHNFYQYQFTFFSEELFNKISEKFGTIQNYYNAFDDYNSLTLEQWTAFLDSIK